jgi:hypothetical protein
MNQIPKSLYKQREREREQKLVASSFWNYFLSNRGVIIAFFSIFFTFPEESG